MNLTSQQKLQKLTLYATAITRLKDPEEVALGGQSVLKLAATARRLKKELLDAGISEELLSFSEEDINQTIFETLRSHGYAT